MLISVTAMNYGLGLGVICNFRSFFKICIPEKLAWTPPPPLPRLSYKKKKKVSWVSQCMRTWTPIQTSWRATRFHSQCPFTCTTTTMHQPNNSSLRYVYRALFFCRRDCHAHCNVCFGMPIKLFPFRIWPRPSPPPPPLSSGIRIKIFFWNYGQPLIRCPPSRADCMVWRLFF